MSLLPDKKPCVTHPVTHSLGAVIQRLSNIPFINAHGSMPAGEDARVRTAKKYFHLSFSEYMSFLFKMIVMHLDVYLGKVSTVLSL